MSEMAIVDLVPHPMNPNRMAPEYRRKLLRNIQKTGKYPPIVVRNLTKSARYGPGTPYFVQAGLTDRTRQILDGENRYLVLKELGRATVSVDDWGAVDDTQAMHLLTTLNKLRGQEDGRRRATLLSLLREEYGSASVLAEYVPEDADALTHKIERATVPVEAYTDEAADQFSPFMCMVDDELARIINAAVRLCHARQEVKQGLELDPEGYKTIYHPYQVGRALASICAEYVTRNA